jgi:hypothetical protein
LAVDNPNVTKCWHGGAKGTNVTGGGYLYNHNWVEYFDDQVRPWFDAAIARSDHATGALGTGFLLHREYRGVLQ